MSSERIYEFINSDASNWGGDGQYACALWVQKHDTTWEKQSIYLDPYDAIEPLARLTNAVGLLEMFGYMSQVDDDSEFPERQRVRVLFSLEGHDISVGVQRQGDEGLFIEPNSDEAQGQFVDFTNAVLCLLDVA